MASAGSSPMHCPRRPEASLPFGYQRGCTHPASHTPCWACAAPQQDPETEHEFAVTMTKQRSHSPAIPQALQQPTQLPQTPSHSQYSGQRRPVGHAAPYAEGTLSPTALPRPLQPALLISLLKPRGCSGSQELGHRQNCSSQHGQCWSDGTTMQDGANPTTEQMGQVSQDPTKGPIWESEGLNDTYNSLI